MSMSIFEVMALGGQHGYAVTYEPKDDGMGYVATVARPIAEGQVAHHVVEDSDPTQAVTWAMELALRAAWKEAP